MERGYHSRQERIITYLEGRKTPTDANTLVRYLGLTSNANTLDQLRNDIRELIKDGLVKAYTLNRGGVKVEAYHLKGKGKSLKGRLQGHGKLESLIRRWFGSIFFLLGFGFLIFQKPSFTGAGISTNQIINFASMGSFLLIIIGLIAIIASFKKNQE